MSVPCYNLSPLFLAISTMPVKTSLLLSFLQYGKGKNFAF